MIASNSRPVPRRTSEFLKDDASIVATSQAASAVHMKSKILTRATGTPRLRAASALPPAPYVQLPKRVRSRTQVASATMASHQTIEIAYTPPRLEAKVAVAAGTP